AEQSTTRPCRSARGAVGSRTGAPVWPTHFGHATFPAPSTSVGSRTGAPALAEMLLDHATSPAPATSVGSRTGAPALAEMPLDHATSPAPATSNATCGFPA